MDLSQTDVYYFAPQKCLGSDGGLWLALVLPGRRRPDGSAGRGPGPVDPGEPQSGAGARELGEDQTLNTPAITTLLLLADQLDWIDRSGGAGFATGRSADSAARLYAWADAHPLATPFVAPEHRSPVVGTIDFAGPDADGVDAALLARTLRTNGIVDVEPYRSLGRNQLRVGMYPHRRPRRRERAHRLHRLRPRTPALIGNRPARGGVDIGAGRVNGADDQPRPRPPAHRR